MRSKSLAQPSAGFSHCLPLSLNVTHKGRKALTAGAAVLAALFSVTAAGAQSLVQVPVIVTYAGNGSLTNTFSGDGGQATAAGISNPEGIAYDGKGNTYIADYDNQRIRVVSATGIINTVFGTGGTCAAGAGNACGDGGPASAATFNNPSAMQFDTAGNLYIADLADQRIRKITATNGNITGASIITTVAGTGVQGATGNTGLATAATLYNPHGLALDKFGNLWIANQGQGVSCTIDYVPAANGTVQIGGVATPVTAGHIYFVAGRANTCGYISDANGTTYGTASELTSPTNIALDFAGNLYIGDYGNGRVRKLTMSTGIITTLAGTGFQACPVIAPNAAAPNPIPPCGDGGLATAATLNGPTGVYIDGAGNVIIGDAFGARVREINFNTGIISTIAGDSQQCTNISQTVTNAAYPVCGDGGPATKALVSFPILISVNPFGNIFYVDQYDNKIREIIENTVFPNTVIGTTTPPSQNILLQVTGGPLTINSLTVPVSQSGQPEYTITGVTGCNSTGTAANAVGTVCTVAVTFNPAYPGNQNQPLVANTSAGTFSFALNGIGVGPQAIVTPPLLNTVAGTGVAGGPNSNVSATTAPLNGPTRVSTDVSGNIYISDTKNNIVSAIFEGGSGLAALIALEDGGAVATPGNLYTLAGTGAACAAPTATPACGDGGKASAATLNAPTDVWVDGAGNLFISDSKDNRVREVLANTGIITTVAGNGSPAFSADGVPPTSTGIGTPTRTITDANGNLYIVAQSDNAIRFVPSGGLIRTLVGTEGTACAPPSNSACGDGGLATAATLNAPTGLSRDLNGNLYIADTGDNRIRYVNVSSGVITTVAGTGTAAYTGDGGTAVNATLNGPTDVYADPAGTLLIADVGNFVIRQVLVSNQTIATVAGNGTACASPTGVCGDGGPASGANFISPKSITLDSQANLYIADSGENRIRKAVGNPTSLTFPPTVLGTTSTLNGFLQNIGNGALTLSDPSATNPSVSANFSLTNPGTGTNCPLLTTTTAVIAAGSNCGYVINFAPLTAAGAYTGQLIESDNSLNATNATQIINFNATASQVPSTSDTLTAAPSPTSYGTPDVLTFCIPVVAGVGVPGGSVVFSYGTPAVTINPATSPVTIGTTPTTFNGQSCYLATTTTANLPVGTDTVTATYTATPASGYASGAPTAVVSVAKAPVVQPPGGPTNLNQSFTATPGTQVFGMPVVLTYTVPVAVGNAPPTGPVVFTNGATNLGTCTTFTAGTTVNGVTPYSCALSTSVLPVGPDVVTATYTTTDPNYAGGTATPAPPPLTAPVTITAGAAVATLTAGPNPATYGTPVTITETLVPINGVCPTSPVSFYSGGTVTGGVNTGGTLITTSGGTVNPATVVAIPATPAGSATSCVASIQTNSLPVGTTDVTATAPANGSFAAVGSGPLPVIINQDAAADTLATTPNPSTFGQPVTITDTIPNAPNGTAPTGTVQFYDYTTPIGTPQPVTGGVATLVTSTLPVGTDSITGVYSGDTNFAQVTSNAVNQVVNPVPTTPTLSAAPNPTTFGTQVTVQETIPVVNGTAPTGLVSFYYELPGSTTQVPIGTFNLTAGSGGVATVTTTTLPVGVDNLYASYVGNGNYAAVTSGPDPETVNKGIGPDTLAVAPNPATFGTTVVATDTIPTVGGVAPTGTVTFYDNGPTGTNLGTFPVTNGVATLSTSTLPVGTQPITAVYNGDSNYGVVTSNQVNEVITVTGTVPALSANPNPTTFGMTVTLTESIPGVNGIVPTGTVTFTYTAPGSTTVVPIAANVTVVNGVAQTTISTLPIGVDKVTAVYSGDTNYATATNTANVTVGLAAGTDTIVGAPNPANSGTAVTFTYTVPVVNGVTPTGTVTFYNGTTPFTGTTTAFNAAGQTTITTSLLPVGVLSITGKYPGDNTYAAGTASTTETINSIIGGDTVTAVPNPTTYGAPDVLTFCIPVVAGTGTPTGNVTFSVGGSTINAPVTIGTTPTTFNGTSCYVATTTTSNLPVGSPTVVTATYAPGPTSPYGAAAPTTPVTVGKAPESNDNITATPNPQTVALPVTLTFSIPVAVGNAAPTGSVTFTYNGVTQGTAAVTFTAGTTANGITTYSATTTTTTLPAGTDTVTGTYTGDANYAGGPLTTPETINPISGGDSVTVSPNPTVFGNPVTISFCIPVVAGTGTPTGTVTFSTGGTTINTPVTIGTTPTTLNGQSCYVATTTTTNLPVGAPTTVTGTYAPGPTSPYGPAAPTGTVTVTPVNPISVVTYGPANPTCSVTLVTLTDTITPVNGVIPTGTVQFYTNTGPIGAPVTITAANNGVATLQIALPCGTTGIYAIFTGNSPYGTSTAPTVPLNLANFTIAATPPAQTVNPGDTTVYTVSLSGAGGVAYTSPVTLTATGLPPGATVTFGTTTYVPGVGPTPTSMTIVTSPTVAMVKPTRGGSDIYYGLLLLPLLGIRRIRKKIRTLPRGIAYGLAALVVLAGLGAMTGCQGGYFGGPPQTYVITVTGTSGTLSHSTTVTLTVE
jgi:hypothetical protein